MPFTNITYAYVHVLFGVGCASLLSGFYVLFFGMPGTPIAPFSDLDAAIIVLGQFVIGLALIVSASMIGTICEIAYNTRKQDPAPVFTSKREPVIGSFKEMI